MIVKHSERSLDTARRRVAMPTIHTPFRMTKTQLIISFVYSISQFVAVYSWQWDLTLSRLGLTTLPPPPPSNTSPAVPHIAVIGAGLPRSGTDSLREALEILGYHAYHAQVVGMEGHDPLWKPLYEHYLANGAQPDHLIDDILQGLARAGYTATTDFPACFIFDELAARFPHAKVILSVRDSPSAWAESYRLTVGALMGQSTREPFRSLLMDDIGPFADFLEKHLWNIIEYTDHRRRPTQASLERAYTKWVQHVQQVVDADRLLLHNAKDGWSPLCQHLDIPVDHCPTEHVPYPRNNSRALWRVAVFFACAVADHWTFIRVAVPCLVVLGVVYILSLCRNWIRWRSQEKVQKTD